MYFWLKRNSHDFLISGTFYIFIFGLFYLLCLVLTISQKILRPSQSLLASCIKNQENNIYDFWAVLAFITVYFVLFLECESIWALVRHVCGTMKWTRNCPVYRMVWVKLVRRRWIIENSGHWQDHVLYFETEKKQEDKDCESVFPKLNIRRESYVFSIAICSGLLMSSCCCY